MDRIIGFYKKNKNVFLISLFVIASIVLFLTLSIVIGHSSGISGKFYGVYKDTEIVLNFKPFNNGKYTIIQNGVKTSYTCTWHNRMVHPQNDDQSKYVRSDGLFSTIDIRFKTNGLNSQRQFYYFNSALIPYWNEEMVLYKV